MRLLPGSGKSVAFAVAASVFSLGALAQSWPSGTVTAVVPWPPGGPSDIAARPLAKGLTEALGQTFVIDNRAGGGGNIGTAAVARSKPDGQTLLITSSAPIVINPSLYKKMTFDPLKDLAPVTNLLRVPLVLVAHPSVPAKTLKELIALIQSKQGGFSYASSGNGTPQHLTGELFDKVMKLNMAHVPYKGSAPAITDLLGGHIPIMFDSTIAIMPHIKTGKVKAIAVSGAQRSPLLPDVPTFAEAGVPVESYAWYGLFAPAGTPKEVVAKINAEAQKVMKLPEYQKIRAETGSDYVGDTPENFTKFVHAETAKWSKVVKDSGATVD
ncbi:Bug family tripartite tricarboxylate transporter substrate binding protein [Pseudoduganella namucuonensis]|uniref:Tripartite-type tricarboxylate transporter, receptor component TctC n=1 Tax=Pseudoduganella namucuonensis TaxID=1035707 RepID=A0A1I7INR4_9BURK|nr:tripartite tricarboxylate transporter substrate binding protein [Pseudoduganella namucuonensis]SFU74548.1 Tripartite-type tricarboxylate transporter, receptor component TctC [Pseudoduganella namucuonensis]